MQSYFYPEHLFYTPSFLNIINDIYDNKSVIYIDLILKDKNTNEDFKKQPSCNDNTKDTSCKIIISIFFTALLVIVFIIGGYICERHHPKPSRHSSDQCYSLTWKVIYGENQTFNSIITEHSLSILSHVFERANEYQVIE